MDPLSRLPQECLDCILEFIVDGNNKQSLATLAALLRVNRYIATVTVPFLYRNPFHGLASAVTCWSYQRNVVCALLSDISIDNISKVVALEFNIISDTNTEQLDFLPSPPPPPPRPLNYLCHLHHLDFTLYRFTQTMMRKRLSVSAEEMAFIEGKKFWDSGPIDRMHLATLQKESNQCELALYFHQMAMYRETVWTLATPILDQLQSLTTPLSDIHRYTQVIDRLGRLETMVFVLEEVLVYESYDGEFSAASKISQDEAMLALIHFVEEHTRLFKGVLKSVDFSGRRGLPMHQGWASDVRKQIYRLLPPMYQPKVLNWENWMRLMTHPATTILGHVQEINANGDHWKDALRDCPQFLQRCRTLKLLDVTAVGNGVFEWAIQEKRLASLGGSNSLVPLEQVTLRDYNSFTYEADDIAVAFSYTLQSIVIHVASKVEGPATIRIGRGWMNMPALTHLQLEARKYQLLVDQMLFAHCPNLTRATLIDSTTTYRCQDIVPALPGHLEHITDLELEGWPALTFHPETLRFASKLRILRIRASPRYIYTCFIPPVEELNRSYGIQEDISLDGAGAEIEEFQTEDTFPDMMRRPMWSWDWMLPLLSTLSLIGEFAFRFQFCFLSGCPSVAKLELRMATDQDNHVRVLTSSDFFIPRTTITTFDDIDPTAVTPSQRLKAKCVTAPALITLIMTGRWIMDDTVLSLLLQESFPRVCDVSIRGSSGFSLEAVVDYLRTKDHNISRLKLSLPEPSMNERIQLGICSRLERNTALEVWHFKILF
ncbi:MAG: hypothetical protein J3R72DRAFT_436103, partial [Linnemannia gamsii]